MSVVQNPLLTGTQSAGLAAFLGKDAIDSKNIFFFSEDMSGNRLGGAGQTVAFTASSGANVNGTGTILNHPGYRTCTTQTSVDSVSGESTLFQAYKINKTRGAYFAACLNLTTLFDATDDGIVRAGLANDVTKADIVTPVHGIYFKYNRSVSVNWLRCTANGSSETATDTGVAVIAGAVGPTTFMFVEWVLLQGGTGVDFWIDGVYVGRNTTNILDETDALFINCIAARTAGSAAKVMNVDLIALGLGIAR